MVTIIPSYMYSIFAALVVGTILVSSCTLLMVNIRNEAVHQQLANVDEYVATQSLILITHSAQSGQNATQFLALPSQIGNREYWISIANDSVNVWVGSGLGSTVIQNQTEISIPADVAASGVYVSGWGRPMLLCEFQNQTVTLTLTSE